MAWAVDFKHCVGGQGLTEKQPRVKTGLGQRSEMEPEKWADHSEVSILGKFILSVGDRDPPKGIWTLVSEPLQSSDSS